ncbi:hypothetical protein BDN72DRAFT_846172 [Pluteus cervinus]|uniref:Uncharacterized protein n=1 Tax=Pluteus cervinus TaxID=181527 RepID=A0ACD3AJC1_9AGAR|nr:hypothetical protein BDN72DRAFT_846172 [Pluteus cervinus]
MTALQMSTPLQHTEGAVRPSFSSSYGDMWTNLSTELLELIFAVYAHGEVIRWPPTSRSYPILVSQVCSRWRQIAFNTPELWSSVHYELFSYRRPNAERHARQIQEWFTRCRTPIIRFYFSKSMEEIPDLSANGPSTTPVCIPFNPIKAIILQAYAPRIQVLHLHLDVDHTREFLFLPPFLLRSLEELHLTTTALNPPDIKETPTVWRSLPNLRNIQLTGQPLFNGNIVQSQLPLSELTYLGISWPVPLPEFYTILKRSTKLEVLRIKVPLPEQFILAQLHIWKSDSPFLPVLRELEFCGWGDMFSVLNHVQVPRLHKLNIRGTHWSPAFLDFMKKHPIEVFSAGQIVDASPRFSGSLLLCCTQVREMILSDNVPLNRTLLQRIASGDDLPYIEHLSAVEGCLDRDLLPSIISDLIRKRFTLDDNSSQRTLRALHLRLSSTRVSKQVVDQMGTDLGPTLRLRTTLFDLYCWDCRYYELVEGNSFRRLRD